MTEWYYVLQGVQNGPASEDEIVALLHGGKINRDTLAWKEGLVGWQPISQFAELTTAELAIYPHHCPSQCRRRYHCRHLAHRHRKSLRRCWWQ